MCRCLDSRMSTSNRVEETKLHAVVSLHRFQIQAKDIGLHRQGWNFLRDLRMFGDFGTFKTLYDVCSESRNKNLRVNHTFLRHMQQKALAVKKFFSKPTSLLAVASHSHLFAHFFELRQRQFSEVLVLVSSVLAHSAPR
jgi:hypothetical protein